MMMLAPAKQQPQVNANGKRKRSRKRSRKNAVEEAATAAAAALDKSKVKYMRGERLKIKGVQDKKLKANLKERVLLWPAAAAKASTPRAGLRRRFGLPRCCCHVLLGAALPLHCCSCFLLCSACWGPLPNAPLQALCG